MCRAGCPLFFHFIFFFSFSFFLLLNNWGFKKLKKWIFNSQFFFKKSQNIHELTKCSWFWKCTGNQNMFVDSRNVRNAVKCSYIQKNIHDFEKNVQEIKNCPWFWKKAHISEICSWILIRCTQKFKTKSKFKKLLPNLKTSLRFKKWSLVQKIHEFQKKSCISEHVHHKKNCFCI